MHFQAEVGALRMQSGGLPLSRDVIALVAKERLTLREAINDFGWLPLVLLGISGGLSIIDITEKAVLHSLSLITPFQVVLDSYHRLTQVIGEVVEPLFQPVVDWINALFHWHLQLQPFWRSLFVLGMVLVAGLARTEVRAGRFVLAVLLLLMMGLGALAGAIVVGLLRFEGGWLVQGLAAALPVALLFFSAGVASVLFQLAPPSRPVAAWLSFVQWLQFTLRFGAIAFLLGIAFSFVAGEAAGILVLGVALAVLGGAQLSWGLSHADRDFTRTGLSVLGGFVAAGLIQLSSWAVTALGH